MKSASIKAFLASAASVICLIHCAAVPLAWSMRPMMFDVVLIGGPEFAFMPVKPGGLDLLWSLWAVGYKYNVVATVLMLMVWLLHRDKSDATSSHRFTYWLALPFILSVLLEPWVASLHWVALIVSILIVLLQLREFTNRTAINPEKV